VTKRVTLLSNTVFGTVPIFLTVCGERRHGRLREKQFRLPFVASRSWLWSGQVAVQKKNPRHEVSADQQAEAGLGGRGDLYRDLVEHSQDLLCTHDLEGRLLSINPLPARLLGYEVEELLQIPMREFLAPEYRDQFDEYLVRIQRDRFAEGSMVLMTRSGERRIWEYYNTLRTDGLPAPLVRGMAHDVTERRRAEAAVQKSEERFRVALKNSPVVVFNQDLELKYTWINAPVLGWAQQEYLGRTDAEIIGGEDGDRLTAIKQQVLQKGAAIRTEVSITFGDEKHYFDLTVEPLHSRRGALVGITCAAVDITAMKQAQEEREELIRRLQDALAENEYLASHDALTGVPNRRLLEDRLEQALARADRQHHKVAVLALDLDNFKEVNDRFGHRVGDLVLKGIAARVKARLRASDTFARTGGDEFTVVADVADALGAHILVGALELAFALPFEVEGELVATGASIGVALYPHDGRSADELCAVADKIMYAAKRSKRG
jgi:diguanylate cyclase (GGDEF)-like protein/PAS domain S-box-containing protein